MTPGKKNSKCLDIHLNGRAFFYILNTIFIIFHTSNTISPLQAALILSVGWSVDSWVMSFVYLCSHAKLMWYMFSYFVSSLTCLYAIRCNRILSKLPVNSSPPEEPGNRFDFCGYWDGTCVCRQIYKRKLSWDILAPPHSPTVTASPDEDRRVC